MTHAIEIGSRAIWVNNEVGCLGRFGVYGIDVHSMPLGECLDCTHGRVTLAEWQRFKASMLLHHGVDLSHVTAPDFAT